MESKIEWESVELLWRKFLAIPINSPDLTLQWLLEELKSLCLAQQSTCVLCLNDMSPSLRRSDPRLGWRAVAWIPSATNPFQDMTYAKRWAEQPSNIENNECYLGVIRDAGTTRAMLMDDVMPGATPEMARKDGLYRYYQVQDRLVGIHAVSPSLEIYFYLDRETGEKFGTLERDQLQYILEGLGPFCRRLAFSYGALDGQSKLSPRERETFLFLLGDKSEKEIAAEMGLSLRSAHQNVVAVYRKLGFSSRASLMSSWMELQGSSAS